jgi:hypothetical protein
MSEADVFAEREHPYLHERSMHRHIIVSGDDTLATTIVEELNIAGASIVKLATATRYCR